MYTLNAPAVRLESTRIQSALLWTDNRILSILGSSMREMQFSLQLGNFSTNAFTFSFDSAMHVTKNRLNYDQVTHTIWSSRVGINVRSRYRIQTKSKKLKAFSQQIPKKCRVNKQVIFRRVTPPRTWSDFADIGDLRKFAPTTFSMQTTFLASERIASGNPSHRLGLLCRGIRSDNRSFAYRRRV